MGKKLLKIHQVDFTNESMEFKWYPVVTTINYERKVGDSLKARFESLGAADKFAEVLVPIREWEDIVIGTKPKKDGTFPRRRTKRSENVFVTGYIFVKMIMDNSTWNIVRQTTGCAGYLKADGKPGPMEEHEIIAIKERLGQDREVVAAIVTDFKGEVGNTIKIKNLNGLHATITAIDKEKGILKAISEMGMKLDVEIHQVEVV